MSIRLRVLIIEDSEDDALLVTDELQHRGGYELVAERVENREQLEKALQETWDVVIADYRLPRFSGMDALRLVREKDPDLPVIVVSGQVSDETAVEALKSGAQDYVLKDNLVRLASAVEREIREARIHRERRQAQEALNRSEQILQSMIDSSRSMMYLKDLEGRYILVNEETARVLRTSKDALIGRRIHEFFPKHVADERTGQEREVLENCEPRVREESIQTEEGVRFFLTHRFPVWDAAGTVYGVGAISTDITESIQLRQELQSALEREKHFSLLLQRALLPAVPEIGPGYDVAAEYVPAPAGGEIGGDFYDVFRVGRDKAGILIGDVSGKGLEAAAMAATTRSTVHAFVHGCESAAEALARANKVMCASQDSSESFATVFLIIIELDTGRMSYASAGHPPPLLRRGSGEMVHLEFGQLPLAVLDTQDFHECEDLLREGDRLLLYTDGISEARRGPEMFDLDGIEQVAGRCSDLNAEETARDLVVTATQWAGQLRDDAAVVVVERRIT